MIHAELRENEGIVIVRPDHMQGLSESDFRTLTDLVDGYLEDHDSLRGLIIVAAHFPGWEGVSAFVSHIKFLRDHHRAIGKVALVSDDRILSAAPSVVEHFVNARVRHFPAADLERAKAWAATEDARAGRFLVLDGYPDDVVAVRAEGVITREDYEETLSPLVEKRLETQDRVKLLYWCGPAFEGLSAGAMWDDARLGLTHLGDFSKIAVVSDIGWVRQSVKLFAPLLPAKVQVFHDSDIEDAKRWISED